MHCQMQHGDPVVNQVLVSLLADCCVPFMEAIQRWVLQGELRDPFSEFLVAANEGVSDNELWHRGYRSAFGVGKLSAGICCSFWIGVFGM